MQSQLLCHMSNNFVIFVAFTWAGKATQWMFHFCLWPIWVFRFPTVISGWIPIFKGMFRHRRDKMVVYGYMRCNSLKFDRNMTNSRHFRGMLSIASMAKTIFWVNQLGVWPSSAIIFMENTVKNTVLANTSGHVLRVECSANTTFHENVLLVTFWFTYFEKNAEIIRCFAGSLPAILLLCWVRQVQIVMSALIGSRCRLSTNHGEALLRD